MKNSLFIQMNDWKIVETKDVNTYLLYFINQSILYIHLVDLKNVELFIGIVNHNYIISNWIEYIEKSNSSDYLEMDTDIDNNKIYCNFFIDKNQISITLLRSEYSIDSVVRSFIYKLNNQQREMREMINQYSYPLKLFWTDENIKNPHIYFNENVDSNQEIVYYTDSNTCKYYLYFNQLKYLKKLRSLTIDFMSVQKHFSLLYNNNIINNNNKNHHFILNDYLKDLHFLEDLTININRVVSIDLYSYFINKKNLLKKITFILTSSISPEWLRYFFSINNQELWHNAFIENHTSIHLIFTKKSLKIEEDYSDFKKYCVDNNINFNEEISNKN